VYFLRHACRRPRQALLRALRQPGIPVREERNRLDRRSLQFAALAVLTNILVGGATFGVVYLLSDAARLTEAAVGLEAVRFIIVGTLLAVAIRYGVRGLKQTRDGVLRRRGWAIVGLVVSGLYSLLILGSVTATAALYLFVL
jgi:hypothetical protein